MSAIVRVGLLLVLGLVVLARGLVYLNDRLAEASRPTPAAAAPAAAAPATPRPVGSPSAEALPAVVPLTPPTDDQMLSLQLTVGDELVATLNALRQHTVTPALVEALDATAVRVPYPEIQRFVACHRARAAGAPLSMAFDALPVERHDVDWRRDSTACVLDVIAARADEDRERVIALFAERSLDMTVPATVAQTLVRLDPSTLPPVMTEAIATPSRRRDRLNAVKAAVAIGAAAKWPDQVALWLRDEQLDGAVLYALAERSDEASMRFLAREITDNPGSDAMQQMVERFRSKPGTLDLQLVAVAADPQAPSFARVHAAHLVGIYGGEEACRRLARLTRPDDPSVRAELDAAYGTIDRRLGPALRAEAQP
jgi:hypothetical protein